MIGVSTAVPSRPFLATGRIGNRQLQGLSALLESTARRGLFRIVLIHHPPVSGVIGRRKRLTDAEAFQSIVADKGAELILHGHAHKNSLTHLQTPTGEVPVFGIPSASAAERRSDHLARYHLYHIRPDNRHWDVRVIKRGWSPTSGGFEPNGMLSFVLARLSAQ
jgi:3',5'-cyclic AMP phosphodiesterase CpdA